MSTQLPPETGPSGPEPTPPAGGGPRGGGRSRRGEGGAGGRCGSASIFLAVPNGLGVIAYVVAWVAIPEERPGQPLAPAPEGRRETGRLVLGGSLVVLGLVLLLDRLAPDLDELFWPVAVIAVGVAVMLVGLRR